MWLKISLVKSQAQDFSIFGGFRLLMKLRNREFNVQLYLFSLVISLIVFIAQAIFHFLIFCLTSFPLASHGFMHI